MILAAAVILFDVFNLTIYGTVESNRMHTGAAATHKPMGMLSANMLSACCLHFVCMLSACCLHVVCNVVCTQ